MHLRPASAIDTETIIGWVETRELALFWAGPDVPDPLTAVWIAEQYRDATRRHLVLIDAADRICAVYSLKEFAAERRLHIGRLAVAPQLRGGGLGSLMIAEAIGFGWEAGAEIVTLYVHERNLAARRLYERLGFLQRDMEGVAILMERRIEPPAAACADHHRP